MFVLGYGNVDYINGASFAITGTGVIVALSAETMFFAPILVGAKR